MLLSPTQTSLGSDMSGYDCMKSMAEYVSYIVHEEMAKVTLSMVASLFSFTRHHLCQMSRQSSPKYRVKETPNRKQTLILQKESFFFQIKEVESLKLHLSCSQSQPTISGSSSIDWTLTGLAVRSTLCLSF